MATVNEGGFRISEVDYDGQKRQFSLPTIVHTPANLAANIVLHDALVAAIQDVTLGASDFHEMVVDRESIRPLVKASSFAAQVNIQWLVTYVDDVTGAVETFRMPCADVTDDTLVEANSHVWDPTDAKWVTFVADFEAYILSDAGNAVSIQSVLYVQ